MYENQRKDCLSSNLNSWKLQSNNDNEHSYWLTAIDLYSLHYKKYQVSFSTSNRESSGKGHRKYQFSRRYLLVFCQWRRMQFKSGPMLNRIKGGDITIELAKKSRTWLLNRLKSDDMNTEQAKKRCHD